VLENAARFSPPHGRLQLRAGANDSELFFSVSDEGPGIPEEERAKIFDMFYTAARGDRGGQGTGLGLAICQGMVGAHGGRISVADGIEGRGTCITLHLPLQEQPGLESEA
jgi:two-component system sensor histidine kinase KdpD